VAYVFWATLYLYKRLTTSQGGELWFRGRASSPHSKIYMHLADRKCRTTSPEATCPTFIKIMSAGR